MKSAFKRIIAITLFLTLAINSFAVTTMGKTLLNNIESSKKNLSVYVNNKRLIVSKVNPYKSGKGYLVPAKQFAKLLKIKYKYYKKAKLVILKKKSSKMYLTINKKTAIFKKKNLKLKVKTRLISKTPMVDAVSVAKKFKYKYSKYFADSSCLVVATKKKYLKNPLPVSAPETTFAPSSDPTLLATPAEVSPTISGNEILPTATPSAFPSVTPSEEAITTPTTTPEPTTTPTKAPTPTPTKAPTPTPTPTPTKAPTPTPTKAPTPTPTVKPTSSNFELLYTKNFEDGRTLFTQFYGDTPEQTCINGGANGTSKALSLTAEWLTCRSFPNVNLETNTDYRISFYAKGRVYQIILIMPDDTRYTICDYPNAPDIANWTKVEYSFSTGNTLGNARDFEFRAVTGEGTLYLDELIIEKKTSGSTQPTQTPKPTATAAPTPTGSVGVYPSISIDPNGGKEGSTYAYRTTGLPVCFINTNDKTNPTNKGVYEEGVMCIEETGAAGTRLLNPLKIQIAVRGNSTSGAPKKPYNIKFMNKDDGSKNKQKVLGMSSHHKWNLLANYYDKSLLRNAVAFKFASQLDGLDYTPDFRFIEVVLNGEYVGHYMITEKVEIAKDRVNISKDNGDGGYGYIIENDNRSPDFQFTAGGQTFKMAFKDPDSDDLAEDGNNNRLNYIKNDIEQTWKNIYNSSTYSQVTQYIDIDSFVDYHIVQDFAMPVDGYFSSIEMYKNCEGDVKLHMGPVWDYDLAFGNSNPDAISSLFFKFTIYLDPVFKIADCRIKRTQRWNNTAKAIANSMVTYLDETAAYIKKSAELNNKRWPLTSDSYYGGAKVHKNNDEEVAYFRSQLQERISVIDEKFNTGWY